MMVGMINMYLEDHLTEKNNLRQGDLISKIHFLGAINLSSIQYSSSATNPENYLSWSVASPPKFGDAMVLSHSCEIDKSNGVKVTSIILAPIRDIHSATTAERIEDLIKSNLIDRTNPEASYLKYFYLAPNQKLMFCNGAVVDFSKSFSIRKHSYDLLLKNKVAQLTSEITSSMALKLALYFHRS
jgi:hypothetical protein